MPFDVELTGRSDYSNKIKMAIAGQAGAGKTLFASTAPNPFFIFFREQPRIMSIADRFIAHTKILPDLDENGNIKRGSAVEDKMLEVVEYLRGDGGELYDTVVIDTGDELQRALKDGKKARNRGKWSIADWGWLADELYNIVNAFIDLPMHVIVLYHVKSTQEGDDGIFVKELALQGSTKDDTPGWFDIVGVLDSYENVDEKGVVTVSRGYCTSPTQRYGWLKDHSGKLPGIFELSRDFVGDFGKVYDLIYGGHAITSEHEVIATVTAVPAVEKPSVSETPSGIPTPEEVDAKKAARSTLQAKISEVEGAKRDGAIVDAVKGEEESPTDSPAPTATVSLDDVPEIAAEFVAESAATNPEPASPTESMLDENDNVKEEEDEIELPRCEVCGVVPMTEQIGDNGEVVIGPDGKPVMVVDETLVSLGKVRFRKTLCLEHMQDERNARRSK